MKMWMHFNVCPGRIAGIECHYYHIIVNYIIVIGGLYELICCEVVSLATQQLYYSYIIVTFVDK